MTIRVQGKIFVVALGVMVYMSACAMKEQEPMVLANPWGDRTYDPSSGQEACDEMKKAFREVGGMMTCSTTKDIATGQLIARDVRWWAEKCKARDVVQAEYATTKAVGRRCALGEELKAGDAVLLAEQRRLMREWNNFYGSVRRLVALEAIGEGSYRWRWKR